MSKTVKAGDTVNIVTVVCNLDGTCTIVGNPEIGVRTVLLKPGESFNVNLLASR